MMQDAAEVAVIAPRFGHGREQKMDGEEEKLICDAELEFHNNATPLCRSSIFNLVAAIISKSGPYRQARLGFQNNKQDKKLILHFSNRNNN